MVAWIKKSPLKDIWQKSGIESLNAREKWVLFGGVIFVLSFAIFQLAVVPFLEARNNQKNAISRKQQELIQIKDLQSEYLALKNEEGSIQARINQRGKGFTLFTFLDRQADKAQVKKQIQYMKPSTSEGDNELDETIVEMKLQQITLESLVNFLRLVESEENVVFLKRFSLQESGKEQGYFDSILQIVTFDKKG